MATGGDLIEFTYNHPTVGTGVFYAKAGEDSTFDLGGLRAGDDSASVDGGGNNIKVLNRTRWSVEGTISWDMNNKTELEKLVSLAADPVDADWTIQHVNGTVYGGTGSPVGDLQGEGNKATTKIKISGGGSLKKI